MNRFIVAVLVASLPLIGNAGLIAQKPVTFDITKVPSYKPSLEYTQGLSVSVMGSPINGYLGQIGGKYTDAKNETTPPTLPEPAFALYSSGGRMYRFFQLPIKIQDTDFVKYLECRNHPDLYAYCRYPQLTAYVDFITMHNGELSGYAFVHIGKDGYLDMKRNIFISYNYQYLLNINSGVFTKLCENYTLSNMSCNFEPEGDGALIKRVLNKTTGVLQITPYTLKP